jgi:hypothetical protein
MILALDQNLVNIQMQRALAHFDILPATYSSQLMSHLIPWNYGRLTFGED